MLVEGICNTLKTTSFHCASHVFFNLGNRQNNRRKLHGKENAAIKTAQPKTINSLSNKSQICGIIDSGQYRLQNQNI